jgi:SAM-dependent methyltransferase
VDEGTTEPSTGGTEYAERLVGLQQVWWKRLLPVQAPYRWNLRRLNLGLTLDVGCGIGRNLANLEGRGVGIDHNAASVAVARAQGFDAMTSDEFLVSPFAVPGRFDSLLVAHVLEHMNGDEALDLVRTHLPYVRAGGNVVLITPQERGFRSDATHVAFMDFAALHDITDALDLPVARAYSFPFPRRFGSLFIYNEFVVVARV